MYLPMFTIHKNTILTQKIYQIVIIIIHFVYNFKKNMFQVNIT